MSGPVDVLEWMRQCAPDEVLAAVTELIVQARIADDMLAHEGFREDDTPRRELRAALARVQGGAA